MRSNEVLIVVGAGHAGAELAVQAREYGWVGRIVLVGDESALPYHRPPLSKGLWCKFCGRLGCWPFEGRRRAVAKKAQSTGDLFKGRHFEREIFILCVRWYLRYTLSLRDLAEMMAERGLSVAHTTIPRWV